MRREERERAMNFVRSCFQLMPLRETRERNGQFVRQMINGLTVHSFSSAGKIKGNHEEDPVEGESL